MDNTKSYKTSQIGKKNDKDLFLKKHVGLIHCENKLTLIQRKICNILLFNALDKINHQEIHEISLRQLCSLVGYNSNDSKLIKEAIKSLITVIMEWNLLEDSKFLHEKMYSAEAITWNASSLLAGATIRNGVIGYSYSPQMKSILSSLDIYGRINLFVQSKFNSTYSLVLYENCVRFKNLEQTSWLDIDLFRSLMGVTKEKYISFKEFKRNVINVAVKEINQKADISVQPHFKRAGRNIVAIQFTLTDNENYKPSFRKVIRSETENIFVAVNVMLSEKIQLEFNLSKKQVSEILKMYPEEYILEKISIIKQKKNISHPGAYFISALKKDYKEMIILKPQPVTEKSYLREAKDPSEIVFLKNKYMAYKFNAYKTFVKQQDENIQLLIKEKFEEKLKKNTEILRFYKKSGLTSPFIMTDYIEFINKNFATLIGEYLSFDDYITSEEG